MVSQRTRKRRLNRAEVHGSKFLWLWAVICVLLVTAMALMIASKDQPANASLEIWSADLTAGENGRTMLQ